MNRSRRQGFALATIFITLCLLCGVLASWLQGQLFPWLPIAALIASSIVVIQVFFQQGHPSFRFNWAVILAIVIGVVYRFTVFIFPASLIGRDPDKYALFAHLTLETGNSTIPNLFFYTTAANFHTYIAQTSAVLGVPTDEAMVIIPVAFGCLLPLTAASICRLCIEAEQGYDAGGIGAIIASLATMGIKLSFWTIAQSLGTLLFAIGIFLLIRNYRFNLVRDTYVIILFAIAMMYTHKLALLLFSICSVGLYVWSKLERRPVETTSDTISVKLIAIIAVLLSIQYSFISDYFTRAITLASSTAQLIESSGLAIFNRTSENIAIAGVVPEAGILQIFYHHSHMPVLLFFAGLAWVYLFYHSQKRPQEEGFSAAGILAVTSVTVPFVILTIPASSSTQSVQPTRIYAFIEPVLAALIGITLVKIRYNLPSKNNLIRIKTSVVILILIFQILSASALPVYPGQPRDFMTQQEVNMKHFTNDFVDGEVHSYNRFSKVIELNRISSKSNSIVGIGTGGPGKYRNYDQDLFTRNLIGEDRKYITIQTSLKTYEPAAPFSHYRYRLTWDPKSVLNEEYNKVYQNDGGVVYQQSR